MKPKLPVSIALLLMALIFVVPVDVTAKEKESARHDQSETPSFGQSPAMKKPRAVPYHGKVSSVDVSAKTFVVGQRTLKVTGTTRITKDGAPTTISAVAPGEIVGGSYWKKEDGSLEAKTVKLKGAAKMAPAPVPGAQKKE